MSLAFLSTSPAPATGPAPVACSPMQTQARAAGARSELRDGWSVVADYGDGQREAQAVQTTMAWVDVSHLTKLELQAAPAELGAVAAAACPEVELELGLATRAAGVWWCPLTRTRLLVIGEPGAVGGLRDGLAQAAAGAAAPASLTDVSTVFAALTLLGPSAREVFARFCAIDLRDDVTPVRGLRPGSVARQPGIIVREAPQRYLVLFGWAVAAYMWTVVADAAQPRGGRPAGLQALPELAQAPLAGAMEGSGA